jgi:hypothetical protein
MYGKQTRDLGVAGVKVIQAPGGVWVTNTSHVVNPKNKTCGQCQAQGEDLEKPCPRLAGFLFSVEFLKST